jgi:hypothetical protein
MTIRRPRFIALVAAILALAVVALWIIAGNVRKESEDEEERITSSAPNLSRAPNGDVIVTLGDAEQARIGIKAEPLASITRSPEVTAYGVVLDPAPLAGLDAELVSARAMLDASDGEYQRLKLLHSQKQNASLKDFQSAQAKFRSDQANLESLKRRLADTWGRPIASLAAADRARLVNALVARSAAIVRVTVPAGQSLNQQPNAAQVTMLGYEGHPVIAQALWSAPAINPELQGEAFMLRIAADRLPLRPGAAVTAKLVSSGNSLRGVVIPNSAIVRTADGTWAYVQIAPTRFERRPVPSNQATQSGWLVTDGFAPGDRIVAKGAQALLSEEFKSQIQVQD